MSQKIAREEEKVSELHNSEAQGSGECIKKALQVIRQREDELNFSQMLRVCREAMGLKRYKAAQHSQIAPTRLKYLELGNFRSLPRVNEIIGLAELYGLNVKQLAEKAEQQVKFYQMYSSKVKVDVDPEQAEFERQQLNS